MKIGRSTFLYSLVTWVTVSATKPKCKVTPNDASWPSPSDWSTLNTTLSGALIQGIPPASVCYPSQPNYNEEACALIRSQWFNSSWHAEDPVSIDYPIWTNNSCNPIFPNGTSLTGDPNAGSRGCNIDTYPAYVVNATNAEQVATALSWAGKKNIRVVVKATGHSYTGRSTGSSSLSIWTHNLRGLSYLPSFQPTSCPVGEPLEAVRVAAGHTNGEIQQYLNSHGKVIVSGANPSVGIVGWLTGGGHGYLSSTYGMGSDHLIEATIVLPSGETVTANPCMKSDIFFAIRGGGGGTFGVVTEVVLKTYRSPKTTMHVFTLSSRTAVTDGEFWDTVGWLHAQMQTFKDAGMQGFYYIVGPPTYPSLAFLWSFMLFDKPEGTVETLMKPVEAYLMERADLFAYTSNLTHADSYFDIAQHFVNEAVASGGGTYGSRLLSPKSLSDAARTAQTLAAVGPNGNASAPNSPVSNPTLIGHMVAPASPPSYSAQTSSLNRAWRDTLVHLVVAESWPDGSSESLMDAVRKDVTVKTQRLRDLSPGTGAYFNEADANEPDWQDSFFGENYDRLRAIKSDVDPNNVLWCRKCVGSEALAEQSDARLCGAGYEHDVGGEEEKSELRP